MCVHHIFLGCVANTILILKYLLHCTWSTLQRWDTRGVRGWLQRTKSTFFLLHFLKLERLSPQETNSRDPAAMEEACAKVSSTHMGATVTPQSPAANRARTLYFTHVYFVVYHFFQETLLSLLYFSTTNSFRHTVYVIVVFLLGK